MERSTNNESDQEDIFSPDMFLNQSYKERLFNFGDINIKLTLSEAAATDFDLTGQVIWPAAQVLSDYILAHKAAFKDKKCLELGSGVGICGLLLAHYCKEVILTDHMEVVLEILQKNVDNNETGGRAKCAKLAWGENLADFGQSYQAGGFDVICGSDIVFWKESLQPLWKTVDALLSQTPDSYFLLTFCHRSKHTEDHLMELADQFGFAANEVPIGSFVESPEKLEKYGQLHVFIFTRKNTKR